MHREQRRAARLGGARPSLDEAIEALQSGASDECLVCSSAVRRRNPNGALVCGVCESVLGAPDLPIAGVLLEAA